MKERVFWSDADRSSIITELVRLRRERPAESLITLVSQAQHVLPERKRRPIRTLQALGDRLFNEFCTAWSDHWQNAKEVVEVPVEVVLEIPQTLKTVPTAELLTELLMRFAGKLDQIERLLPTASAPPTQTLGQSLNQQSQSIRTAKPKVVVAGAKLHQFRYVEAKLGHAVVLNDESRKPQQLPRLDRPQHRLGRRWVAASVTVPRSP